MGCGETLVKYILFLANLVFALGGLILLVLGVLVQLKVQPVVDLNNEANLEIAPVLAMTVGSMVFLISFFGCCGAIKESNCMLVTYSICMLILMVIKLALAIVIFVNLDALVSGVPTWMNAAFNRDRGLLIPVQEALQCCGTTGPSAYTINPMTTLPASCCAADVSSCILPFAYSGCNEKVQDIFNTFGIGIGVLAIIVCSLELVAVVFGLCLANHARNKSRRAHW